MHRQPFPVQRMAPYKPADLVQKQFEFNSKIQPQSQALGNREYRASINKLSQEIVCDVPIKVAHGEVVPRSAPLRLNKLVVKDDTKEFKDGDKKNNGGSVRSKFPEIQTPDRFKGANQLRMPKIMIEENKKGSASVRRQKESPAKAIHAGKFDKNVHTPDVMYGFETERIVVKHEHETDKEKLKQAFQTELTPRDINHTEFVYNSPSQTGVESDGQDEINDCLSPREDIKKEVIDEVLESAEEFGDSQLSNNHKPSLCQRGMFRREHISAQELQKQNDQKKIMKEYLDQQLNEKKRQKEEAKQKERELEKKEEERVRNERMQIEKRHEKELALDLKKAQKFERSDSRKTNTPQSKGGRSTVESAHFDSKEEKVKSKEQIEATKNKMEEPLLSSRETLETGAFQTTGVDDLVEENKQLRDENIKKKEIIDILINALRQQQSEPPRVPLYQDTSRKNSSSSRLQTSQLPASLAASRNGDSLYNQAPYHNDGSYDEKFFVPPSGQIQFQDNILVKSPKPQMVGNIDMSTDISQKHYLMSSPGKNSHPYRIFVPFRKDFESPQHRFQVSTSPRTVPTHNGIFSPASSTNTYINELQKHNAESKQTFLPSLNEPYSAKSYQKSNLLSNLDMGISTSSKYYDSSKYNSPAKPKESHSTMKHSFSEMNLAKGENSAKLPKDPAAIHKNLLDLLNPISLSKVGPSKILVGNLDTKVLAKAEYSITVVEEGKTHENQSLESYPLRSVKSHENLKALNGISIVDMANRMGSSRRVTERNIEGGPEELKLYGSARTTERISSEQTPGVRAKFPTEVFSTNVKRNMKDRVKL